MAHRHHSYRITIILAVTIGGMVFLSTGIALALSSTAAYRNTVELLRTTGLIAIDMIRDATERHVTPARAATEAIARMVADGTADPENTGQVETLLRGVLAATPQIAGFGLWDPDYRTWKMGRGAEAQLVPGGIEDKPSRRRLLNALRQSGNVEWGPPTLVGDITLVNVAKALYRDGRYLGSLATGVSVDDLSKFVADAARELNMTAFILYGDSLTLAHPELVNGGRRADLTEAQPLLPVTSLKDGVVRRFKEVAPRNDVKRDGFELRSITSDDISYLVLSRSVQSFGNVAWTIGIYAPVADLTSQIRRLVGSIAAGIGILLLSVAGALVLARRLARPINRIAAASEKVGQLELDTIEPLPRSWITEIDQQAVAFNRMVEGLRWFETYVPQRLVARLIAGTGTPAATSQSADLTIMFTDIIGFTHLTEHMAPEAVGAMLNEHFAVLGRCIEDEGGTLDKYIGDAVMAFWGAPEDQPDHAVRACRAAIEISRALDALAAESPDHLPIRIKIAIHSGPVLVGNIGAPNRINYTVVGDAVNTASRIESLCRDYDDGRRTIVLVSGETAARAADTPGLTFTPIGSRPVKGRDGEVRVFRLETGHPDS